MDLFLDHKHEYAGEFKLAIKHSLELIHPILGENGALQWKNRFQCIANSLLLQLKIRCPLPEIQTQRSLTVISTIRAVG